MSSVVVLILSYNDAATIAECVGSVVSQRRRSEVEAILLADDASADDSVTVAQAASGAVRLDVLPTPHNYGPWPNLNRSPISIARCITRARLPIGL
jgi:glycosyltransferase involved in cell wall biosynthesis